MLSRGRPADIKAQRSARPQGERAYLLRDCYKLSKQDGRVEAQREHVPGDAEKCATLANLSNYLFVKFPLHFTGMVEFVAVTVVKICCTYTAFLCSPCQ